MKVTAEMIFSKILDTNDPAALKRYDIREAHMATEAEREALRYIREYAAKNAGKAPSHADYLNATDAEYFEGVTDDFGWLADSLKADAAKREVYRMMSDPKLIDEITREKDGRDIAEQLRDRLDSIIMGTSVRKSIGRTLEQLKDDFRAEYERRKAGESFKIWRTPFDKLNAEIGGLYSGDIYGFFGESGRGKSYSIIEFVECLLRQGATVFVKSFEMNAYRWLSRLLSSMTSKEDALENSDGETIGVPSRELLAGKLNAEYEAWFFEALARINEYYPGELILQAKGDAELTRSLDELDRELAERPDIDVLVVDPIYGFSDTYGKNSNKTAGGAAEQMARRFETLVGVHNVVGIYAVQATTDKKATGDNDERELRLPDRDKVKTSKALLEVATVLFAFDSVDGRARLGIEKGRDGGEDFTLELVAMLDYGVLRELPKGAEVDEYFAGFNP